MMAEQRCALCGGITEQWLNMPIDAKKNSPTPYRDVIRCKDCGHGVLYPLPSAEEIPEFYILNNYYTHGQTHIRPVSSTFADKILIKLSWLADRQQIFDVSETSRLLPVKGKVCDLGCGHAHYLQAFKRLDHDVLGVDPDPSAQAEALKNGITVALGTAENIPAPISNQQFDLVIMTHSLEHCRDPVRAIHNAFALTKPGGYCYVEVPNCASEHFKTFTICSEMFDAPRHIHFFTPSSLRQLMVAAGYLPMRRYFQGYGRNFHPSWRAWEAKIAENVISAAPDRRPRKHSFGESLLLFLRSFLLPSEKKYDSIGFLMKRPLENIPT